MLLLTTTARERAWRLLKISMVQDSITDNIDTARENSSHLNFTYRMAIIFAEIAP